MNCLAIIQARLGSTRCPRKVLHRIDGVPMLAHVTERVCRVPGVTVVVACPARDAGEILSASTVPVIGVHGDENDVLHRYAAVSDLFSSHDAVMRVTGDCPRWSPELGSRVLRLFRETLNCDYATNVTPGYVDGEDVQIFSRTMLRRAHGQATSATDREHVTPWIERNAVRTAVLMPDASTSIKTSIDTPEELDAITESQDDRCYDALS